MKPRRLTIHHILPALSLVFTLFVFAPVDLYLTSAEDLWFGLEDILPWLGLFGVILTDTGKNNISLKGRRIIREDLGDRTPRRKK